MFVRSIAPTSQGTSFLKAGVCLAMPIAAWVLAAVTALPATSAEPNPVDADAADSSSADAGPLRHAVFFQLKPDSYPDGAETVTKAFDELPKKIDAIKGYVRGENTHKGLDAGLTHGYILTFDDAEGRSQYLPHPDHRAFGKVLDPHRNQVFVIDYHGESHDISPPYLSHHVFFRMEDDATPEQVKSVVDQFLALEKQVDSVRHLEHGINNSPESHDAGFTHAFTVIFDDAEGLAEYGPHPAHQALIKLMSGVVAETRVIDLPIEDIPANQD